jgi:4-hydroxy-tetrahydrodipicolinate synthase
MSLFGGLSAFPITPTTAGGKVITEDLKRLVNRIEAGGANSVGLLGSTGTYMFLSREERRRAVAAAVESAVSIPIIVGVGAMRTDDAQDLARDAAAEGASGLILAPVAYTSLREEEVFEHFLAVASASNLPLCIYSNPSTTNFTFAPDLVARLSNIPTIAAIKLPLPASGDPQSDLSVPAGGARSFHRLQRRLGLQGGAARRRRLLAQCGWGGCSRNRPPPWYRLPSRGI